MSLSNHAENLLLDWLFGAAVSQPAGAFVSLHNGDPGEDGANEIDSGDDTDYVRKSITMGSAADGQALSTTQVTWTAGTVATPFSVTHACIWDAVSGGNCLMIGPLTVSKTISTGTVITFEIGEVVAVLD